MSRLEAILLTAIIAVNVLVFLTVWPIEVFFWLTAGAYIWYAWSEFRAERRSLALQNANNIEMETL